MTVGAITATATSQAATHAHGGHGHGHKIQDLMQMLGQDLSSGDVSSAQSAFSALQADLQPSQTGSGTSGGQNSTTTALDSVLNTLSGDLNSGNLSAAQTDYSQLTQSLQSASQAHRYNGEGSNPGVTGALSIKV